MCKLAKRYEELGRASIAMKSAVKRNQGRSRNVENGGIRLATTNTAKYRTTDNSSFAALVTRFRS